MDQNKNVGEPAFHTIETYHPAKKEQGGVKSKLASINTWLKTNPKIVLPIVVLFLAVLGGGLIYWMNSTKPAGVATVKPQPPAPPPPPKKFYSPLTGLEAAEADTKRPVTGVMIENSPEARPQSGLKESGVVFESVAEGGITRFLALFQETKPGLLGPVRSVRPHYASWVAAFDAGLAHVGGSSIPLQKLRSGQIKDLDQFFSAGSYYRANDRYAPHNVYTTDDRLQALNQSKGYTSSTYTAWARKKEATPSATPTARTITVPVSTGLFTVNYDWDQASNTYLRKVGGLPHNDREKGQLSPKVVIVLQVPHDVIRDTNGYRYPEVIGSGKGWLYQDGVVAEIRWAKVGDKEQISFTDAAGKVFELNPGQTWITAIRPDRAPTWQ
jgi:hypothetical protein